MSLSYEGVTDAWLYGLSADQLDGRHNGFGGTGDPDPEGMSGEGLIVFDADERTFLAAMIADGYVPTQAELPLAIEVGYRPPETQ